MDFSHIPVMLSETKKAILVRSDGIYIDGTVGGGGHAFEIARELTTGHLYAMDQDPEALAAAKERLFLFADRVTFWRGNYETMAARYQKEQEQALHDGQMPSAVSGILLDLGVSSYQLDNPERGFSYMDQKAPLDMRMDPDGDLTAADLLNRLPEEALERIFREYGEERFASSIAMRVCAARKEKPFALTEDLNRVIFASIPVSKRERRHHPSRRVFQALRIAVNRELAVLSDSLEGMIDLLEDGGRLCIITFHSLEDRIVKEAFRRAENPCTCPPKLPVCVCGKKPKGRVITRRPLVPSEEEKQKNPRSQSAKLRVFERQILHDT